VSEKIAEWFLQQVRDHGFEALFFGLAVIGGAAFAFGYVAGWWRSQKKTKEEIRKLKLENQGLAAKNLQDLEARKAAFSGKKELLDHSLHALLQSLTNDQPAQTISSSRDEVCRIYESDYLAAMTSYVEFIEILCTSEAKRHRVTAELTPGLQTMVAFLDAVNHERMISKCGCGEFKLRKAARDGIFHRITDLLSKWSWKCRYRIYRLKKRTTKHVREE
jgi:hypothetical protein